MQGFPPFYHIKDVINSNLISLPIKRWTNYSPSSESFR